MERPFETFKDEMGPGLTASGAALPDLFCNAALALTSLLVDSSTVSPGGIRERVRVHAADKDTLLADWLNQILFLFNVQQMVFAKFYVRSFSETAIEAEGEGELLDPGRHRLLRDIKTGAFHGPRIEKITEGWAARISLGPSPHP